MFQALSHQPVLLFLILATLQVDVGCKSDGSISSTSEPSDIPQGADEPAGIPQGAEEPSDIPQGADEPAGPSEEPVGYDEPPESYVRAAFRDDFNGTDVDSSVWQVATWSEHGGQTGTERCYVEDGYLKMVFINDSSDGYLSSAIQSREEFYFGRWEARMKPSNVPGVLNSMYTIDWDNTADDASSSDGTKQEIDIEFLTFAFTGDDGRVHFAVHASGLPSADTRPDILLGFDPSVDFHVWGFDITPEKIEWFVDDQVLWTYSYEGNPITIDAPYMLKFNVWSSTHWVNGPPTADVESVYLIDWVRFTPHGT